jgi:hypothetical protein
MKLNVVIAGRWAKVLQLKNLLRLLMSRYEIIVVSDMNTWNLKRFRSDFQRPRRRSSRLLSLQDELCIDREPAVDLTKELIENASVDPRDGEEPFYSDEQN